MLGIFILFFIGTFIPICANRKNNAKNEILTENKHEPIPVFQIHQTPVVHTSKEKIDGLQGNLKNNIKSNRQNNLPLKTQSKNKKNVCKDEQKKVENKVINKITKDCTALKESKIVKEDNIHVTAKQIGNIEVSKNNKKTAKEKTNNSEKKIINDKSTLNDNKKKETEISSQQIKESSKKTVKEATLKATHEENDVDKQVENEIDKEYQENVNKVKIPFDSEIVAKDKDDIIVVGQLKVHKGLEVWACDSISK
ncbi:Hypothetical protein SRAE_1000051100 [Strongyloides ratti]|uniref:Uncharacterized protein n=1 Tax=Strongyloides ratti TaxID=34506 RepID=A0A090MUI9_STRRB|nr:Hypothetical protein SRAE_1000051100 [Strongyloides ratti]CEF62238.1 Hypothetical protein SRAE_1000051100 [Strongyloides ratti]